MKKDGKIVNHLKPVETKNPVQIEMAQWIDEYDPLPISGGWGYSKDDAVIIETNDPGIGISLEYDFLEHRTMIELAEFSPHVCDVMSYQRIKQRVCIIDNIHYDIIESEVTVKWRNDDTVTTYHVEGWFNVEKLFETYSKITEENKDVN